MTWWVKDVQRCTAWGGAAGAQGVHWGVQGQRGMGLQLGIRFKRKLKVKERE